MRALGLGLRINQRKAGIAQVPLLDDYPGAVAAYSFRLLNSSYSGDVILVERSAGSPTEQGFAANDSAGIETFCSGVTGNGKTWYDQTGNGNHATESTFANQPKIHDPSTGLEAIGGNLALKFNGTSSKLQSANFSGGTSCTVFIVAQSTTLTDRYYIDGKSANNRLGLYSILGNTGYQAFTTGDAGAALTMNGTGKATAGNLVLITIVKAGASSKIYQNGVEIGAATLGADQFVGLTIGSRFNGASFYPDKMQELIIYNSDQSANRVAIETAINDYYSIY